MIERIVKAAKKSGIVTSLRLKFPRVFLYLVVKPLTFFRYRDAKQALKGKVKTTSDHNSILLFTTEKCASTYTTKIIEQLASENSFFCADVEAYFSVKSKDPKQYFSIKENRERVFNKQGRYLGPLRNYYPIEDLDQYLKVLVLRDPRDVLTSFYYSKLYSHIVISEDFYQERKKYESYDIDRFVIEYLPVVKATYQTYCDTLIGSKNLISLPYELLVSDFDSWLDQLLAFLDLKEVDSNLIDHLKTKEKNTVADGNQTSHIRNKAPGDYKRKLKIETQDYLTQELQSILNTLNYAL